MSSPTIGRRPVIPANTSVISRLAPLHLDGEGKLPAGEVARLNDFLTRVVSALNGGLSFGPGTHARSAGSVDGQWLEVPSTGSEQRIAHGLGRIPQVMCMVPDGFCQLKQSRPATSTDIWLTCDTPGVALKLLVF